MTRRLLISLMLALVATLAATAQRRVTPVDTPATATQHINENQAAADSIRERMHVVEITDSRGNKVMVDTVTGREFVDSAALQRSIPKMIYPTLHSVSVSVDIFQPLLRAFGQHYGLIGFSAEVNLHNRYIPVFEVGLGQAKTSPADNNYTYSTPLSPYFKIGANYNFLYNSNPDYLVMAGFRYGFTPFRYSVTGITQPGGYWDEPIEYDIPSRSVTAGYFELMFGLRVKLAGNVSLGWMINYHSLLHDSDTPNGNAWYIPGMGSRDSSLGASFTVTYTLPLNRGKVTAPTPASSVDNPYAPPVVNQ